VSTSTVEAPTAASTAAAAEDGLTDIYVGKGRYVKDDPKKYPAKDDMGPFIGAVGACLVKPFALVLASMDVCFETQQQLCWPLVPLCAQSSACADVLSALLC
jgi:hypothetical protein